MPQDISNDPRILMAEYALKRLKDLTINKKYKLPASKENTLEAINRLNSTIKNMKYSFIPPLELVNNRMFKEFDLMANQFWDAIVKNNPDFERNPLIYKEIEFIFKILKGLETRLLIANEVSLDKAIDIIAVKILTVSKLSGKDNLFICRVGDGTKIINIITNLKDVKKDLVLPAAILPPREFESEISDAMFCSSKDLPDMHGHVGERVLSLSKETLKEVNFHILKLIESI